MLLLPLSTRTQRTLVVMGEIAGQIPFGYVLHPQYARVCVA